MEELFRIVPPKPVVTEFTWKCPECGTEVTGDWSMGKPGKWSCCGWRYEMDAAGQLHSGDGLFPYEIERRRRADE